MKIIAILKLHQNSIMNNMKIIAVLQLYQNTKIFILLSLNEGL